MMLHYRKIGEGEPLFILHGLFGSSDNWQTLAKSYAEDFQVFLVDQRNHGHSFHSDTMDYYSMADDLFELIRDQGFNKVNLMGHSMGGKTVMFFAQEHPELINKMIIVDMGIKRYPPHHQIIFDALLSVDLDKVTSRKDAEDIVKQHISDPSVIQFLLKNLYWGEKDKLAWRFNLDVLFREIDQILEAVPEKVSQVPSLFLRGGKSNYVLDQDWTMIQNVFPNSKLDTITNAGHWVHAEAPKEFLQKTLEYLKS